MCDHPTNFILVVDCIWITFQQLQGILQVLAGLNGLAVLIDHIKSEISHQPQKRREFFL